MKKLLNKITNDSYFVKGTIGVMLCLLALFGALNTGIVSQFFTWLISFFFGWFFYVFYFILFLVGIKLIFAKSEFKFHWDITIFGVIILLIGCLILATNSITNGDDGYLTFKNFYEKFQVSVQGFPIINYAKISGGFFGYLFVAILNSGITFLGTQIVGSVFVCAGIIMSLIKTIIRLVKNIKDYKNRKIKKIDSDFQVANDAKPYDTNDILSNTRTTTVITPDSNIPKENTQSIAIQNPNGGVGVGLTSINRAPAGLGKAKYNPNNTYNTYDQTTTLSTNIDEASLPQQETSMQKEAPIPAVTPKATVEIPIAKKAEFKNEIDKKTLELAQADSEDFVVETVKTIESKKAFVKKHKGKYVFPDISLLSDRNNSTDDKENIEVCEARKEVINQTLENFKVGGKIVDYKIGSSVTRFNLLMNDDESGKTVEKYVDDIASRLRGISCRFVQVVPGLTTSALEIANKKRFIVNYKDCLKELSDKQFNSFSIPFGKDISGDLVVGDLADFPHLLVCGTTGSGKSVFLHTFLMTLIMRNNISNLKVVIIDPKRVEFSKYREMPFLLCPPIVDTPEATLVLEELCKLMDERYDLFDEVGVDNIKQYNKYCSDHDKEIIPRIVVLIDEYADLAEGNKIISNFVVRIAQKARAAGIHLVIATQRPSVNVITGSIKSNISVRVALLCSSATDSGTILGSGGAEKLLGNGDMLVQGPGVVRGGGTIRVQGAYVDNNEIKRVIDFLKTNYPVEYDERFVDMQTKSQLNDDQAKEVSYDKAASDEDKYKQIRADIMLRDYCSMSYVQRTYGVGFNRAGKIVARLESDGVISSDEEPARGHKVLVHSVTPTERTGSVEQSSFVPDKKG